MRRWFRNSLVVLMSAVIVLLHVSCASTVMTGARSRVIAHRGGASLAPENSIAAIRSAMVLGVDAVEIDVRMSADGKAVVFHDKKVDRKTDGKGVVNELSFEELRSLSLLLPDGGVSDERIPLLDEVLAFVDGRCQVLIEVKDGDSGVEAAVIDAVARHDAGDWVAVQAFNDEVLERFRDLGVTFPLEKLFVFKLPLLPYVYDGKFCRFSMEKYDYISSFNIKKKYARKGLLRKIKRAGKGVKVWTLEPGDEVSPELVDWVITDYPQSFLP